MIVREAPGLPPAEAARRVAASGSDPVWLSSPGLAEDRAGRDARPGDAMAIAEDVVAADPWRVARGCPVRELEDLWHAARERWRPGGTGPVPAGLPIGVGWLAYDLARRWSGSGLVAASAPPASSAWPDLEVRFFDALWIRDAATGVARIAARDDAAAGQLLARLERPAPLSGRSAPDFGALISDRARAAHEAAVERIKDYLRAGDAYQVNLARRVSAPIGPGDPLWIAERLRERAPAPFAVWMGVAAGDSAGAGDAGGVGAGAGVGAYLVGNSPERFLRVRPDGRVETRPIKGTRPRGGDAAGDEALREELARSGKDRAEHIMIVDLERNDLGRVCQTGSVAVEELMRVIELPTVFHLVSTVSGRLRPEVGLDELLRATFPGGSITGAPKRRAMEIIEELEPVRRGVYTGATGWFGAAGDLDLAVAIRTATVAAGRLSLFVGGGIVVDSDPASEWEETEVKARAFRQLRDPPSDPRPPR